jgi:glutaredoxin
LTARPAADRVATATITVYSKPDCHLCEEAMSVLHRLREELCEYHVREALVRERLESRR